MSFVNAPLDIKVNGQRALRLAPGTGDSVNIIGGWTGNIVASGVTGATIAGGGAGNYFGDAFTNAVESNFSTVSGGLNNRIEAFTDFSVIAGGSFNSILIYSDAATIGGGEGNVIDSAAYATVAGSYGNRVQTNSAGAIIGGGINNTIDCGSGATIGGGGSNVIQRDAGGATIGGGSDNIAEPGAYFATILGGYQNSATNFAFAAGIRAKANHTGSFVWADVIDAVNYPGPPFRSTAPNEFAVRATGGVRFVTAIDTNGSNIAGVTLASGSGTWSSLSDRNAKENFAAANAREILDKVAALPMASWNYKAQGAGVRHLGPTAQDFHAAFGLGESDRTIATVDADGVALAAIQGLNQKVDSENAALREELNRRDAEMEQLKRSVVELKQLLSPRTQTQSEPLETERAP
jgi:hypothetical protein